MRRASISASGSSRTRRGGSLCDAILRYGLSTSSIPTQDERLRGPRLSMLRYMLDTNLCVRVLREKPASARARFNENADGLCISTVVLMELLHGAAKSGRAAENRRA